MRIGIGYDAHRLVKGRSLILGGVFIENEMGLLGHSDADVLIHAIMDALLGALALGDIGKFFPDSDPAYKDIKSLDLLQEVYQLIKRNGYEVVNIDSVVVAQKPKLAVYLEQMRNNIAQAMKIDISSISIKATTEEAMGFTGREEGISSKAVCLIKKIINDNN
jgi:2-C-methyl-D-erythritol 2,4-cyclodiphosphate synthase